MANKPSIKKMTSDLMKVGKKAEDEKFIKENQKLILRKLQEVTDAGNTTLMLKYKKMLRGSNINTGANIISLRNKPSTKSIQSPISKGNPITTKSSSVAPNGPQVYPEAKKQDGVLESVAGTGTKAGKSIKFDKQKELREANIKAKKEDSDYIAATPTKPERKKSRAELNAEAFTETFGNPKMRKDKQEASRLKRKLDAKKKKAEDNNTTK